MNDLQRRALELLVTHRGACCVERNSEMHNAFAEFERMGLVTFQATSLMGTGTPMLNVYIFNFKPVVLNKPEKS